MPLADTSQNSNSRPLTIAAHTAFVPIGVVTVLLGPLLPILSARWTLDYSQAGSLFTAQFAASSLGVFLSGFLVSRRGFRFAIKAGLLTMAVAVGTLPFTSHWMGMACIASYGFGLGVSIPACNLLVAEVNPSRRSAALSLLNFSWSVGAVACPFLVGTAAKHDHIPLLLCAVAAVLLFVMLGIEAMPSRIVEPARDRGDNKTASLPINWTGRHVIVLLALFFLYVGTENSFGGWIASYARTLTSSTFSVMTPSFFYLALLIGRWLAPLVLRYVGDITLARAGLSLGCAGMAGLVFSHSMNVAVGSVSVAGFGLAAVYPITIAMLSREFGTAATRVGSVVFVMSNFGGACLPWLVGVVSERYGHLAAGLAVPLVGGVVMVALYFANWKAEPARQPSGTMATN